MLLIRAACCAYWGLLSLLLLHPDPLALFGIERLPGPPGGRGLHFVFFAGLAFLTAASRFSVRRGVLAAVLVGYAVATEALQAFVPNRTVDAFDAVENVVGLVAGTVIWRIVWKRLCLRMLGAMAAHDRQNQESDDGENHQAGCP
jgi:VanZ like protein